MTNEYDPDTVSPPGDTINDLLSEYCLTTEQLSKHLQLPPLETWGLITGDTPITESIAEGLAALFSTSKEFWINRESNYVNFLESSYVEQPSEP